MMYWTILVSLTLLFAGPAAAQEDPPPRQRTPDPIADNLLRPDLMLKNHQEVGLSEEQSGLIRAESQRAKARFSVLQRDLQKEVAALGELLRQDSPDEVKVMTQLDKVLAAEREIKRAQLALTLAIKKMLTPEQQARARNLRRNPPNETRDRPERQPSQ